MITFENGLDFRCRQQSAPAVARFYVGAGVYRFVVIGTAYGHWHTVGGDIRTWKTYSGANKARKRYVPL